MAADFYPVLSRAIAGLNPNSEEARAVLFARARQALAALPTTKLSGARLDLGAELAALEAAIERIECENRYDQPAGSETQPANFVSADQPTDTNTVDASQEFTEQPERETVVHVAAPQPNRLEHFFVTELLHKQEAESNAHRDSTIQDRPGSLVNDWPPLTSERGKSRRQPKAIAAAAAVLIFGVLGYVGMSGTRGPSDLATKRASSGFLYEVQVYGIKLRMDGHAATTAVAKFLEAQYGPIQDRLWDWKVCSPEAEKAMSADGVERTGWLKKYCFAIISFGEASSTDRAKLHLVEDPASHKSIVGSFQLTLGSNAKAVDPELILREAISQYGEPRRIRSPGGRSGRCLVWGGDEQAYLEFCTDSCCVAITFEDQDLIRYATLDYGRRMGIIAQPTSQ